MRKEKYSFLKPIFIWMAGVFSLFPRAMGRRDAKRNQVCEYMDGHITPTVNSKVRRYDSHINKIFLKTMELEMPLYKETYGLVAELENIMNTQEPEIAATGEEEKRQRAKALADKEKNAKRREEILIRLAEIKAESDMVDELICHYEERCAGILHSCLSKYWQGIISDYSEKLEHFPAISHGDSKGREAYENNRNELLEMINSTMCDER